MKLPQNKTSRLEGFIDNPSKASIKANKAYRLSKIYTWEKCVKDTFQFFNDIIFHTNQKIIH